MLTWPSRLFYGWKMVALGAWTNAVASAVYQYGFAIFFLPISRDLGTTRAETSLVFSLSRAEGALGGPLAGFLVDRFGAKPILFGGALLTGLGYLVLPTISNYFQFLLVYLFIISVAYNGGFQHPVMTMVNSWFIRRRGLAFAITQASFNIGGAIGAPILAFVVTEYGWRTASVASAIAIWVTVLPTSLFFVSTPEKLGMRPDGEPPLQPGALPPVDPNEFTVSQALRTAAFWQLALATTLRLAAGNTLFVHMVPLMVWKGATETEGAIALGALALLGIPTRIIIGITGDQLPKNLVVAGGMVMGMAGLLELLLVDAWWSVWLFVFIFSIMEGVIPLNWAMIGDFFGRARFATLRGIMGLVYTWGAIIGPVAAGAVYDQSESYAAVVWAMAGLFIAAALMFVLVRPPQPLALDRHGGS